MKHRSCGQRLIKLLAIQFVSRSPMYHSDAPLIHPSSILDPQSSKPRRICISPCSPRAKSNPSRQRLLCPAARLCPNYLLAPMIQLETRNQKLETCPRCWPADSSDTAV